jgi:hypothetical protein
MSLPIAWVLGLHLAAALLWAGCAIAHLVHPEAQMPRRWEAIAVAAFAAFAMPLAGKGGWWIDMPAGKMVPAVAGLSLALALAGTRGLAGRLAALALAGFYLTLGIASLRNGGPLAGFLAAKALVAGAAIGLLVPQRAVRARAALIILLLGAGAALGVHGDIPLP